MPSVIAKLNCLIAGTFVSGVFISYLVHLLVISELSGSTPAATLLILRLVPYALGFVLMVVLWWRGDLFPKHLDPGRYKKYLIGQSLVTLCNCAVATAAFLGLNTPTQSDTVGAFRLVLSMVLLLPALGAGLLGLSLVASTRSNPSLERP
jgi:hypothetical protein